MAILDSRNSPSPTDDNPHQGPDSVELNVSDSSEMELETAPQKKPPTAVISRASASDSDSIKTRDVKYSILDHAAILPHLLPENPDLEVLDTQVFHWRISDWKALEARCHSPPFQAGGFQWRILLFPNGNVSNNNNVQDQISVYLEVVDPTTEASDSPKNWHVCAQFSLVVSNPTDPTIYFNCEAHHRFSAEEIDWGFTRFCDLVSMTQPNAPSGRGPFLINNQTVLSAFVRVMKDETGTLWLNFANYDSRKETGYVGIKNQGATCYMNSLLQSLYCTNSFRRAVYQIPTESDKPSESVPLALQRCFYNLQYSNVPVGTTELTKSFGWDTTDSFMQHDVQEFNRVLQDILELKMKGTPADGAISKLFVGKMKSYIKCINVDYESSRVEDYYDIQLNVRGCKTLVDSFRDYVTVETLEGENKYMAEGHGLQDARKGVIFESFPPVLHLQLKRFEYDFMRDTMVKINDHQEFPEEINLDEFCSTKDPNDPSIYVLHGVLVHSGDVHGGHYFAMIKPEKDGKWLRFDDDRVTRASMKEVFEDNFGDETVKKNGGVALNTNTMRNNSAKFMRRYTNAYMLVYIRKSQLDNVLGPVLAEDIPPHLKTRLNEERAALEQRKKEREDMHLHVKVAVVTDASFANRQGFDIALFDDKNSEVSHGVDVFRVLRGDKISVFKQKLEEHYKLQGVKFRLWNIVNRANETVRVGQPLTATEENKSAEKLRELTCLSSNLNGFAKIYLEVADSTITNKFPNVKSDICMIFIKYFDVEEQKITGLGHLYVKRTEKVNQIAPILCERAGLPKDTTLSYFEETKPSSIAPIKPSMTFGQAEILNGDIVCFQKAVNEDQAKEVHSRAGYATVQEHFEATYNRVVVCFKPKTDKRGPEVKLTLDRRAQYSVVAEALAEKLNAEAAKIRFTTANHVTNLPKDTLPYSPRLPLDRMVHAFPPASEYSQAVDINAIPPPLIYYEILDVALVDLQTKKPLRVTVLGPTLRDETTVSALVPKLGNVSKLLSDIASKSKLEDEALDKIRVYEAIDSRISREFSLTQSVSTLDDKLAVLYVERIPKEELEMTEEDRLVQVVHYNKDPTRLHSIPFRFVVKKDEPFVETKKRLQQRTGMTDKEWQKVKFSVVKGLQRLNPEVIPIDKDDFQLINAKIGDDDALAMEHIDKSYRGSRFGSIFDRGIFIRS